MRLREGRLIRASSQEGQSVAVCYGVPSLFPPSAVPSPHPVRTPGRWSSRKRARGLRVLDSEARERDRGQRFSSRYLFEKFANKFLFSCNWLYAIVNFEWFELWSFLKFRRNYKVAFVTIYILLFFSNYSKVSLIIWSIWWNNYCTI